MASNSEDEQDWQDDGRNDPDVDDSFRAILEGLRTTLPGTQALFGFLLILPMQASFSDLPGAGRTAYYVAFLSAAISSVLLIAPSAHQRLRAPRSGVSRHSHRHLRITVGIANLGTFALAIALAAAVFLVSSVVFSNTWASAVTAAVVLVMSWAWFYVPLVTFSQSD